jgi:hypothetical protein
MFPSDPFLFLILGGFALFMAALVYGQIATATAKPPA